MTNSFIHLIIIQNCLLFRWLICFFLIKTESSISGCNVTHAVLETHQAVGESDGACRGLSLLLASQLVCCGFLKLRRQLRQVLIKLLSEEEHRQRKLLKKRTF